MFFKIIMPQRGRFRSASKKVIENNFSDVIRVKKPVVETKVDEDQDTPQQSHSYNDSIDTASDIVSNISLTVTEVPGNQINNSVLQFYSDSFTTNSNSVVQLISYVGEDTA